MGNSNEDERHILDLEDDVIYAYNFILEMERGIKQFKRLYKPIIEKYIGGDNGNSDNDKKD